MNVEKRWFADFTPREIDEIRARRETVVVVDLWAATTNIVLMLAKRPERLIIINDEKYSEATNVYPGAVLVGQSHRIPQEEFVSASNRSFDVDKVDVEGKVVFLLNFQRYESFGIIFNSGEGVGICWIHDKLWILGTLYKGAEY